MGWANEMEAISYKRGESNLHINLGITTEDHSLYKEKREQKVRCVIDIKLMSSMNE